MAAFQRILETTQWQRASIGFVPFSAKMKKIHTWMAADLVNAFLYKLQCSQSTYRKGLDPMSTCIRLTLLKYKPLNTKLSFCGPAIDFDLPQSMQGRVRDIKGAKRDDLAQLKKPLEQWKLWYDAKHPVIAFLNNLAIAGLKQLQHSYAHLSTPIENEPLVCPTIELFIRMLSEEDETKKDIVAIPGFKKKELREKEESALALASGMSNWIKHNATEMPLHFRELWSEHLLNALVSLFKELESHSPDQMPIEVLNSIEVILSSRDHLLLK